MRTKNAEGMTPTERRLLVAVARAVLVLFEPLARGRSIVTGQITRSTRDIEEALRDLGLPSN